jgi:hypothetical protein
MIRIGLVLSVIALLLAACGTAGQPTSPPCDLTPKKDTPVLDWYQVCVPGGQTLIIEDGSDANFKVEFKNLGISHEVSTYNVKDPAHKVRLYTSFKELRWSLINGRLTVEWKPPRWNLKPE